MTYQKQKKESFSTFTTDTKPKNNRPFGGIRRSIMKIIETIQIGDNGDGTYKVWSKSHDEVVECDSYNEALFIFRQFFTGIMDEYNDAVVENEAYRSELYEE
jgi:hypothetical protein